MKCAHLCRTPSESSRQKKLKLGVMLLFFICELIFNFNVQFTSVSSFLIAPHIPDSMNRHMMYNTDSKNTQKPNVVLSFI